MKNNYLLLVNIEYLISLSALELCILLLLLLGNNALKFSTTTILLERRLGEQLQLEDRLSFIFELEYSTIFH